MMISGIDDQPSDSPNSPIRSMHVLAAAHLHFTHGDTVIADRMGTTSAARAAYAHTHALTGHTHAARAHAHAAHAKSVVRQREHLLLVVAPLSSRSGQELGLFRVIERVKLRLAAPQLDLLPGRSHEIDWYEMTRAPPMSWFHGEVGDRARDGIHDHALQHPAAAVATSDFASNAELRTLAHGGRLPSLLHRTSEHRVHPHHVVIPRACVPGRPETTGCRSAAPPSTQARRRRGERAEVMCRLVPKGRAGNDAGLFCLRERGSARRCHR